MPINNIEVSNCTLSEAIIQFNKLPFGKTKLLLGDLISEIASESGCKFIPAFDYRNYS
jgi:hypothetical protein